MLREIRNLALLILLSSQIITNAHAENTELRGLLDDVSQLIVTQNPFKARWGDVKGFDSDLPDLSYEGFTKLQSRAQEILIRSQKIDHESLDENDQVSLFILQKMLSETFIKPEAFWVGLLGISSLGGYVLDVQGWSEDVLSDRSQYEGVISRLNKIPAFTDSWISYLREGIKLGITASQKSATGFRASLQKIIDIEEEQHEFCKAFSIRNSRLPEIELLFLRRRCLQSVTQVVLPEIHRFLKFFDEEYFPKTSEKEGLSHLARGKELYRHLISYYTTQAMEPRELFDLGMSELKDNRIAMEGIKREVGFSASLSEFKADLRHNPIHYPKTADELVAKAQDVLARVEAKLPEFFRVLPKAPYRLKPKSEPGLITAGYSIDQDRDGNRVGVYFINTADLHTRPLFEMPVLSVHEAIPGHHLQLSLSHENESLPPLRRSFYKATAYTEGWGLYSESVGMDMGLYETPYERMGMLSYDAWRASRLVVDTGLHAFGWTREEAIEFMVENTALTRGNIEAEVNRYLAMPGQALAYKVGQLKILDLRRRVEAKLGKDFDVREFHDVILRNGAVPMDLLERVVVKHFSL